MLLQKLTDLFCRMWDEEVIPQQLKDASIIRLYIIYSQVMKHYTKHNFINGVQHGFLKGLSCDTQLVTTVEELQRGLDKKAQYDVIVLDFQNAFDKVSHRHLLRKLHAIVE